MMVSVLVNATTTIVGGGVQAAISFIEYALRHGPPGVRFVFAISTAVQQGLGFKDRVDPRVHVFELSPSRFMFAKRVRRRLLELEKAVGADIVYSIGFPSYTLFRATEVGWYTNGWEICSFPVALSRLPKHKQWERSLKSFYRLQWAKSASYFHTETELAKQGIIRKLGIDPEHILVLPNSVNQRFVHAANEGFVSCRNQGRLPIVFCLSAGYPHKNLAIIPAVVERLVKVERVKCKFVLTLPPDDWRKIANDAQRRGVLEYVDNAGPLTLDQCVAYYRKADCLFLPTLAEIFSVTYLEAMIMRVPIVTTDLDFARGVCGDAAIYYKPLSPKAAAHALVAALTDRTVRKGLIDNGLKRLSQFPKPDLKHRMLIDWLVSVAQKEKGIRV